MVHSNRNPRANLGRKRLKGQGTAFPLSNTSAGARAHAPSDLTQEAGAGKPNRTPSRFDPIPRRKIFSRKRPRQDVFRSAGMGMT